MDVNLDQSSCTVSISWQCSVRSWLYILFVFETFKLQLRKKFILLFLSLAAFFSDLLDFLPIESHVITIYYQQSKG